MIDYVVPIREQKTINKDTALKIAALVPALAQFMKLHPDDRGEMMPLLGRAAENTIAILQAIEGSYLTYKQIAAEVGIHPNTVKTILLALQAGGYPGLSQSQSSKWTTPKGGRYRRLNKLGEFDND